MSRPFTEIDLPLRVSRRLTNWLSERRLFMLSLQRRRLIYLVVITISLFLLLERYVPALSWVVVVTGFMALYGAFLTTILAVKRYRANKNGSGGPPPPPTQWPPVCAIVAAHNEQGVITATVQRLLALDYPDLQVLVMEDRSQDNTALELQALWEQCQAAGEHRFSYIRRPPEATPGKSAVLNDALKWTEAPVLAVFDADAEVDPDFIKGLVPYLCDSATAAVQARKVISNYADGWLTRCQGLEYTFDAHLQCCRDWAKGAVELRGNGQLVKREIIEQLGGWNETSITDDLDLSTRLHLAGWDIRFVPHVMVREQGVTDFWPLIRQRCRWAEGSLRRYLEHGGAILFSPTTAFRTRVDLLAYFVHFLFPLLIFADNALVVGTYILQQASTIHALLSFSILPLFAILFVPTLYVGIRRFDRPSRVESLKSAFNTAIYMTIVWLPVVFYTFAKVLLAPRRALSWCKTTHHAPETLQQAVALS